MKFFQKIILLIILTFSIESIYSQSINEVFNQKDIVVLTKKTVLSNLDSINHILSKNDCKYSVKPVLRDQKGLCK